MSKEKQTKKNNLLTVFLGIIMAIMLVAYIGVTFFNVYEEIRKNTFKVSVANVISGETIDTDIVSIQGANVKESKTKAIVNGKTYIKSTDTVVLNLDGTDANYLRNTLTAANIVVKVGGTEVSPSTKNLSSATSITNGVRYTLTLSGISGDGELTVEVAADTLEDKAGNKNIYTTKNLAIYLDNTAPSKPTIEGGGHVYWSNSDPRLIVHSTESGSGVAKFEISEDGATWNDYTNAIVTSGNTITYWTDWSNEINGKVYFRVTDKVGNVSQVANTDLKIDKTPPVVTLTRENFSNINIDISELSSGISGYAVTNSDSEPSCWITVEGTEDGYCVAGARYDITGDGEGARTYYVWAKDGAGNINYATISAYDITKVQSVGTTITTRVDGTSLTTGTTEYACSLSTTSTSVTERLSVLSGTPVYVTASTDAGYSNLVLKKDGTVINSGSPLIITSDVTLTSTANRDNYSITYNLNGGNLPTGKTNPSSYNVTTATFTLNNPTKTGYTFTGWTGTGLSSATSTVTIAKGSTGNRTYTANWTANTYTIKYWQGNNTTTAGSTQLSGTTSATYGTNVTLQKYAGTAPAGWTFAGWSTTESGTTVAHTDEKSVSNLTSTANGTVNLYAVFKRTIKFNSGVNKVTTSTAEQRYNPYITTCITEVSAPAPSVTNLSGWTALGYRANSTATTASYAVTTAAANITPAYDVGNTSTTVNLYAVYSRTVTLYHGKAKASNSTPTQYYNTNGNAVSAISAPAPSVTNLTGWTALGYRADTTADTATYAVTTAAANISPAYNVSSTLYAVYSRNLTMAYNGNGSDGGSTASHTSPQYYNTNGGITSVTFTTAANGFAKTGYIFSKWADGGTSGTQVAAGGNAAAFNPAVDATGLTKTMYAIWTANTYTIKYYQGNNTTTAGSTQLSGTTSATYGTNVTLQKYAGTAPTGWTFAGWSTTESGTTVAHTDEKSVSNLTSTANGTVNLYAVFKRTIKFNSGVNKATTSTVEQRYNPYKTTGSITAVSAPAPSTTNLSGWTALGYIANTTATTATYAVTTAAVNITPAYDVGNTSITVNLYAVYSRNLIMAYNGNGNTGGSTASHTLPQYYNTNGGVTSVTFKTSTNGFTKTGYTFSKWADGSASGTQVAAGGNVTFGPAVDATGLTKTMYAIWTANTNTKYVVNHYVHDLGATTYSLNSTENKTGTTDSTLTLADLKKTIAGFTYEEGFANSGTTTKPTSGAVTSTTILANGTRVINLYYRRNYLYVQYDMNGGHLDSEHVSNIGTSGSLVTMNSSTKELRGLYGGYVGEINLNTYTANYGLANINNPDYICIFRTGYSHKAGLQWSSKADGTGSEYDQDGFTYSANDMAIQCGKDLSQGDQTITVYANWVANEYDLTYDYDENIFESVSGTLKGLSVTYNATDSTILFNGTGNASEDTHGLGLNFIRHDFVEGERYRVSIEYINGSYQGTGTGEFAFDLARNDLKKNAVTSKNRLAKSFISGGRTDGYIDINQDDASEGKYIRFYLSMANGDNAYTFTNYKVKITITRISTQKITYDQNYGTLHTPTRDGYTFNGWYTGKNGIGTQITSTTKVTTTSNQTVYAKWTAKSIKVNYNSNILSVNNIPDVEAPDLSISYDQDTSILTLDGQSSSSTIKDVNLFKYTGLTLTEGDKYQVTWKYISGSYTGAGSWNFPVDVVKGTASNLSTRNTVSCGILSSGSNSQTLTISSLAASEGNGIMLHIWAQNGLSAYSFTNYKIKITMTKVESTSKTFGTKYGTLMNPSRTGYTFKGWLGENLFNENTKLYLSGSYINGSNVTSTNGDYSVYQADIKPNTKYVLVNSGLSNTPGYVIYDASGSGTRIDGSNYQNNKIIEFTTASTASAIRFSVVTNSSYTRYDKPYFELREVITTNTYVKTPSEHTLYAYWKDETKPIIKLGYQMLYQMRTNKIYNPTATMKEYPTTDVQTFGHVFWPIDLGGQAQVIINTNENLKELKCIYTSQNVTNYDSINMTSFNTDKAAQKGFSKEATNRISESNLTMDIFPNVKDNTHTSESWYVYVKATDRAGNVTYSKAEVMVYSKYAAFLYRSYYNVLNRTPEPKGLTYWENILYKGSVNNDFTPVNNINFVTENFSATVKGNKKYKAMGIVLRGMLMSDEFMNKNYSDEEFITYAYRTILYRNPNASGKTYQLNQLASGKTRDQVIGELISSTEAIGLYDDATYGW